MKKLLLLIIVCLSAFSGSVCFGQAKDSSKTKSTVMPNGVVTDSTALLGIRDIQSLSKFLEDKMLAKDYNLVMNAISQLLELRAKEYAVKPKNK